VSLLSDGDSLYENVVEIMTTQAVPVIENPANQAPYKGGPCPIAHELVEMGVRL